MSEPITPALSPEEWKLSWRRIQCFDSWDNEESNLSGVGEIYAGGGELLVTGHEYHFRANFSAAKDRHALAALALHGQPFGFSHEDVETLERALGYDPTTGDLSVALESLRDRIAALLPPEAT